MENFNELAKEYRQKKALLSQKELAEYEHQLWSLYVLNIPKGSRPQRRDWLKEEFGGTNYDYEIRATLLAAGVNADVLWGRIRQGMPLRTALRLFREAKKLSVSSNVTLFDALNKQLQDYDSLSAVSVTLDGRVIKRKEIGAKPSSKPVEFPSNIKLLKQNVRALIDKYLESFADLDSFRLKEIRKEAIEWIEDGLDTFNRKLYKLKSDDKEEQLIKIGKTRFTQAVEILGLSPSQYIFGKPIPLKNAKRSFFKRIGPLHPDKNEGSREKEQEYQAVIDAYRLLEQYAEQFGIVK